MPSLTVYCSSSTRLVSDFHDVARDVGASLGRRGVTLVFGGGRVGLMGEVAGAARAAGSRVVGIITETLAARELADQECDELIVVPAMRERKRLLRERGDGYLVLPGGIGTYEEFFDVLVGRKLGEHDRPIGVVNCHGYYNPLVAMIEHGREHGFVEQFDEHVFIHPEAETVVDWAVREAVRGQPSAPRDRCSLPTVRSQAEG